MQTAYRLSLLSAIIVVAIQFPVFAQNHDWRVVDSLFDHSYHDLACSDSLNCVSIGQYSNLVSIVRKTSDGGKSWETVRSDSFNFSRQPPYFPPIYREVSHPQPDRIIVACDSGIILRSIDSGRTWVEQRLGDPTIRLTGLDMVDDRNGIVGQLPHSMFRTTDGGATWQSITPPSELAESLGINDFVMPDSTTIIAHLSNAPDQWELVYSNDAGKTWEKRQAPPNTSRMHFINPRTGWAVGIEPDSPNAQAGRDLILHTLDGGNTWETQLSKRIEPFHGLYTISFADLSNGMAAGPGNKILKTTDGGKSWEAENLPLDPATSSNPTALQFITVSRAFAATSTGMILRYDVHQSTVDFPITGTENQSNTIEASIAHRGNDVYLDLPALHNVVSCELLVYGILGDVAMRVPFDLDATTYPVLTGSSTSALPPGTYFLRFVDHNRKTIALHRLIIL